MFKEILRVIAAGVTAAVVAVVMSGGANFAGITHLSGLRVGADGFSVVGNATTTFSGASGSTVVYQTREGIDYAYVQQPCTATSSSPVIISNPFGAATSSIDKVIVQITSNGIGQATTYDLATTTSSAGNASSTPALVYAHSIAASGTDTLIWNPQTVASTTLSIANSLFTTDKHQDGRSPFFLGPSANLAMRIATSSPGTFASYYTCTVSATFSKP